MKRTPTRREFLKAGSAVAMGVTLGGCVMTPTNKRDADLILHNGKFTTLDPKYPKATNVAIKDGRIVGVDDAESYERGPNTRVIDLKGRRVIPGLNDSHTHVIRGGLSYNLELRWDGVPSLADGLRMLREQVQRTPPGQWVRVIGSWSEFQFAERRMPTLEEINAISPETPVFVLHLYCRWRRAGFHPRADWACLSCSRRPAVRPGSACRGNTGAGRR